MSLVIAVGVVAVFAVTERPLRAPEWLRDRIEARLDAAVPNLAVDFGQVAVRFQRKGLVRIVLTDVVIRNSGGTTVAELSDLEAALAPVALLRGQPVLREATVSGAFVTLVRSRDGTLGLALGDAFAGSTRAPDLPSLIAQVDRLFTDDRLAQLDLIEADGLTVRYEDARARRGWTADGGRLRLVSSGGSLRLSGDAALLGGGDAVATISVNADSPIGSTAVSFGIVLTDLPSDDIATQSPALAWLEALQAPISGALRSRMHEDGTLGRLDATLQIGAGVLQPNARTRAIPFDGARTYFTYTPSTGTLRFNEISVRSELGEALAEGKAVLRGTDRGWLETLEGQFTVSQVRLAEGPLYDRPVTLSGADMAFQLALDPFRFTLGELRVTDPELPIRARGRLTAEREGWNLALMARAPRATPGKVLDFWPGWFRSGTRDWVSRHVIAGDITNTTFLLRAAPGERPWTYFDFDFDAAEVIYNMRLAPVTGGAGRFTMEGPRLAVTLDRGQVRVGGAEPVEVGGSTFVIEDVRPKPATGTLMLAARGPVTSGLAFIDQEPLSLLTKAGRDAGLATGYAEVTGRLSLPLRRGVKFPDMDLVLQGDLRDVASDRLVEGRRLTAPALTLDLDGEAIRIGGDVELGGVPASGSWRLPFDGTGGQVTADVRLTAETLAAFGVTLPSGMLAGRGTGALVVDLPRGGPPAFSLQSDLAGLALAIPQLGWRLPEGARGAFRISGRLGKPVAIDGLTLSGGGLDAAADIALSDAGAFRSLSLSRLRISDWLDVAGSLTARGPGQAPAVSVTGGRADLRGATFGSGGTGTPAGGGAPVQIALDSLQVTDTIRLDRFRGAFRTAPGLQGDFTAMLGGRAPIEGQVVPQRGASAFRIKGEDAGDILKAAGLLKTVSNGTFALTLLPVRGATGSYDGALEIRGARLRNAPAIGALLDAISIVGLLDQLNGPGIFFSEVEAEFRLTPRQVILTRSSAVGPSMGISLDGFYDIANGTMDMQGVVSPVYVLNAIGRLIARKGEGLIGFNFNLRGPVQNPQVLVNPLSVFTPGMFRDIFRRPPPEVSQ
ncbi:hypothetical protein KUH32_15750 [Thalassococcus sp. CAU 1522]|uniref:AsmA-like C-terminal region n=2 Tax=Thalassococcus arenae TaxID=2851652 RepID=A0ABS6NB60_9RHOB|nr:AsmA-like C-terminal region-containing protein [Thalassococcus arenae]MBV2361218.1 hypothetical protein [Thalassococcus arenae]